MMETFLNVGINEEIAAGLAHKRDNPWFAWDNYRRFLQCYVWPSGWRATILTPLLPNSSRGWTIPLKKGSPGSR